MLTNTKNIFVRPSVRYNNDSTEAFFLLVTAGLFGRTEEAERLLQPGVDWAEVYQLAKEQSVVGLATGGIETLLRDTHPDNDIRIVPKEWAKKFASATMRLEQRNMNMNRFIAQLSGRMKKRGIHALLLKGQGVAQCYEKPLWRTCGDVDLLVWGDNYQNAKEFLRPYASHCGKEHPYKKHFGMTVGGWTVELHGNLRCGYSARIDKVLDNICAEVFSSASFSGGKVTSWMDEGIEVPILGREDNVLYVFVHFMNHFYKGGVGIRQICDWCRLLWTHRDALDRGMLESRLKAMGLMSEWRAFGAYAVEYLGMPREAMPFYADDERWRRKARHIQQFILMTGNMGHNRSVDHNKLPFLKRKLKSTSQRIGDLANHMRIFPLDTVKFLPSIFMTGLRQK